MKENMKGCGWAIGYFVVFPLVLFLGNQIFMWTKNDGKKYYRQYIENSAEIRIIIPYDDVTDWDSGSFAGGVRGRHTKYMHYVTISFFSTEYNKYFRIYFFDSNESNQYLDIISWKGMLQNKSVDVMVNKEDLNNLYKGRRYDNPIPILKVSLPPETRKATGCSDGFLDVQFANGTRGQAQYERRVILYLTYLMPKEEFKQMFKNKRKPSSDK
jgi:hypothetical protein